MRTLPLSLSLSLQQPTNGCMMNNSLSPRYILIRTIVRAITLPIIVALPIVTILALDAMWVTAL